MAVQKKKTVKKPKKTKVEPKTGAQEPDSYFVTMMVGYLVLLAGVILLLGCITISIVGEHENWLGNYFGVMFPSFMTFLFGRVAVVVFTAALVLWGLFIAIASLRAKLLRFAVGASLLVVNVSFLMSLKNFGDKSVSNDALSMSGGVLGEFFLQNLAIPVFGRVSYVAPLIILLTTLALILVLSFGVRPRHFKFVAQTMRYLTGLFGRRRKEDVEPKTEYVPNIRDERSEKKQLRRGVVMEDETMIFVPDSVKMRRRGKVEPFNGRHNWLTDDLDINRSEMQTQVGESFGLPQYAGNALPENAAGNAQPGNLQDAPLGNAGNVPAGATLGGADEDGVYEDPEIRRLEEELRLNERHMNALQILEIKERIGALRRARDLIDWEKGHKGRMQVKGDVRRTTGSETVGAAIAGNAGGNVSPKSTKPMTVTTPRVAKPSGGEDGDDEDGGGSMKNEKLDKLLFEVAQWAISVNGLSTSAVQRHFSVWYSRAGKIVDQLYGLGVCGPSKGNSKPRAMLVGMDELMQLERSGRFG